MTLYQFSREIFLEAHVIRLCPRNDGNQFLLDFNIEIEPVPSGMCYQLDAEGNTVVAVWFDGVHSRLKVSTQTTAITSRQNPFDFLVSAANATIPLKLNPSEQAACAASMTRPTEESFHDDTVLTLANQLLKQAENRTVPFATALCQKLYEECEVIHRDEGAPRQAADTWRRKSGACRDLAVLYMDVCRSVGIPARFVSGYQEGDPDQDARDLHAWPEIYMPDAGWRGFDPTHGLTTTDRHIAVAAASNPADAAPISGTFRGTGATALISAQIELEAKS